MNEKATSALQKAQQERKRGQYPKAVKRLEQAIASFPDELDLYLEAIDTCLEGGEVIPATQLLKTVQDKFARERDRVLQFVREKLQTVHDASLARCVVENAVKRRDLEGAMALLEDVPDHTVRDLSNRARTKMQSLKSATHGGYTLRGEMVTNELTNALLSTRLGNLKEAVSTLVKILEDKPVEHKMLDPFLAGLEIKNAKSGRIRFARACALRAAGNEVDAVARFIEAARLEPACAAVCAEQLRAMQEHARHPEKLMRALAEVLLIKGDLDEAAATLRENFATNPERAREIVIMLRPYIEPARGINACTWLAIEAALSVEQSSVALDILRPLHQNAGHGAELYEWFEARAAQGFLPADAMVFHATLALDQKQYERAAEILGAVCAAAPNDAHGVLALIDKHRSACEALDALYRKYAATETGDDDSSTAQDDGADFQMFDNREFRLETSENFEPAAPKAAAGRPGPQFAKAAPFGKDEPAAKPGAHVRKPLAKKSLMDARELSFDDDALSDAAELADPADAADAPAGADDGIALERSAEQPQPAPPARQAPPAPPAPRVEVTESHVSNVAQKLYEAGAAAFFHIDDADAGEPAPAPASEPAATAVRAPELPQDFEAAYARFTRGELDNTAIIALIERAVEDGRVDELHELLLFEPATSEEHFARYFHRAEYFALRNRPLQALEILARLDAPGLDNDEKRRVWYKIAVCQRMTRNFEGANATLERLVEHFPDHAEFARLKRRNHEQFLEAQSGEAAVLEKTSTLD